MIPLMLFSLLAVISSATKNFNIEGKIVLLTGGAKGIGLATVESLLQAGVKGVTLVDINIAKGRIAAKSLNAKYGYGRVIFLPADVSNEDRFEDAFKISIDHWKGLDIVVNNAGVVNENYPNATIDTNIVGVVHGTMLGLKYMSKANGGGGGVIINVASIAALNPVYYSPVYSGTKSFVLQLGRALGHPIYYDYHMVSVVTVCFGATTTELTERGSLESSLSSKFGPHIVEAALETLARLPSQSSKNAGDGVRDVIEKGSSGSVWVIEGSWPAYEVEFPNRKNMSKIY